MNDILFFALGFIVYAMLPILDSIVTLFVTLLEYPKGLISLKIAKLNKQLLELQDDDEEVAHNVIGFQIPSSDEEYYEEEEDDE